MWSSSSHTFGGLSTYPSNPLLTHQADNQQGQDMELVDRQAPNEDAQKESIEKLMLASAFAASLSRPHQCASANRRPQNETPEPHLATDGWWLTPWAQI